MRIYQKNIHEKFVSYGANAKEWTRKCAMLLPDIEKYRIWEQKNFFSIYDYAARLAGMSRGAVDDALRILKRIDDKPALKKIAEKKGLNAVRPVVTIATAETAEFWAAKVMVMSKNTLETYVKEYRKQFRIGEESAPGCGPADGQNTIFREAADGLLSPAVSALSLSDVCRTSTDSRVKTENAPDGKSAGVQGGALAEINNENRPPKRILAMELEPEIISQLEKLKGGGGWNSLMKEFLQMREEKLESEKPQTDGGEGGGAAKSDGCAGRRNAGRGGCAGRRGRATAPGACASRHIPAKIKRFVIKRTNGQCAFPGCNKPYEILHHAQRFSLEPMHDPDRLQPLCAGHERIAHMGLIENEELPPESWKIKIQADEDAPKYEVDMIVNKFRIPGKIAS